MILAGGPSTSPSDCRAHAGSDLTSRWPPIAWEMTPLPIDRPVSWRHTILPLRASKAMKSPLMSAVNTPPLTGRSQPSRSSTALERASFLATLACPRLRLLADALGYFRSCQACGSRPRM